MNKNFIIFKQPERGVSAKSYIPNMSSILKKFNDKKNFNLTCPEEVTKFNETSTNC